MDKSGSVSPPPRVVKILNWVACAFVSEASERKTQLIFNTSSCQHSLVMLCLHNNKPTVGL